MGTDEDSAIVAIITTFFIAWCLLSLYDVRLCLPLFTVGASIMIAWAILGLIAVMWERLQAWRSRRG